MGAAVREVLRGGLYHVVYDGGLPAPVRQGTLSAAHPGGAGRGITVTTTGETPGRSFRRADPAVPGTADGRAPRRAAQTAAAEVRGSRSWRSRGREHRCAVVNCTTRSRVLHPAPCYTWAM